MTLLWYFRDSINGWIVAVLGAILVGGLLPSLGHLSMLFASHDRVRQFMDEEKKNTMRILQRHAGRE